MKTMQRYITLFLLLFGLAVHAQDTVSGVVVEAASGTPLPGVNVIVKGTTRGTATDFDGNFTIEAEAGEILVVSYIGFVTQEVPASGQNIRVALTEDSALLDEVVVIGYGTVKKEDATGAVNLVTSEDFNQGPIVSAQQLIQGKVAGVSISSGSGAPGDGAEIRVRGNSSLSLSNNPLYVVDGVPLNDGGVGGSRNVLNVINPNDIESISILKDASATSIYGARAANGVVMITTKKGKAGELKFNYSGVTSVYEPVNKVDVLSAAEFRNFVNTYGDADDIARLGTAETDWQDLIYNTAFGSDHTISAQGGVLNIPFRASVGYTDQQGILKGDNLERITGAFNLRPRLLEDDLQLEFNARVSRAENIFANRQAIGSASVFDPTQSVYDRNSPYFAYNDENGDPVGYFTWLNNSGIQNSLAPTNPVALLDLVDDQATVDRFIGNVKVDYSLPWIDGLTATVNAGYDYSESEGFTITQPNIPSGQSGFDGSKNTYRQFAKNKLLDAYLTYKKDFETSRLEATAGYSYQMFEFDNTSNETRRILNPDGELNEGSSFDRTFIDRSKNVLLSYFGRVNYEWNNRYLATATLRADASSKLNPDDRWGYFPSIALGWNIHNENFFKSDAVNQLKLRIGYGEVGNVNGLGDYGFLTRYVGSINDAALYQFGSQFYNTYRPEPINENIKWEIGSTLNAGLDFAMFENRITGSVNAYIKKTNDLIARVFVDPFTNFGNQIDANVGDMENKGIEIELGVVPVETEDFTWTINYNVAFNDNTITNLPNPLQTGGISGGVGNFVQRHEEGRSPFGFYVYKQIYDEAGNPIEGAFADINGDGQVNTDDRYFYKDPYADIIMGLNTSIKYKKWDFQAVTRANIGNYVYNNLASNATINGVFQNDILTNTNAEVLDSRFFNQTDESLLSDYYIENASFFRIDNVTLGYTFEKGFGDNPFRVYAGANNLLVVSNYDGLDPEIPGGIDNNFYPRPRVFVLGLNLNF